MWDFPTNLPDDHFLFGQLSRTTKKVVAKVNKIGRKVRRMDVE